MRRRDFVTGIAGSAATWPLAARAQQPERMRRIGVLMALAADDPEAKARIANFRQELQKLGWPEGRNVRMDLRFAAGKTDQFHSLAKELISFQPDVILAQSAQIAATLQRETRAIPIVFVNVSDPIGAGFVSSLARPAGNLTGVLLYEAGIVGKWLALLKEFAPRLARAALLANPKTTVYDYFLRAAEAAAPSLGIELLPIRVGNSAVDIQHAIESFAPTPNAGLLVLPDPTIVGHRERVITLAAQHHLPAVYPFRLYIAAGGLMCYGVDQDDVFRLAASYVDRILRGAKPADLPVQAPTKYETIINLKTAKALGFEVPPSLLVRADEVIE